MKLTQVELNRLVDAYWEAVDKDRTKLAEYIRQVCLGCCGIDVAEEE